MWHNECLAWPIESTSLLPHPALQEWCPGLMLRCHARIFPPWPTAPASWLSSGAGVLDRWNLFGSYTALLLTRWLDKYSCPGTMSAAGHSLDC